MMTNDKKRRDWARLIAEYRSSELSMRAWCEKSGFTFHQLRYWNRKLGRASEPGGWSAVEVVEDDFPLSESVPGSVVTVRVGSAAIDVHPGFDQSLLSDVLRVVVSVC
jgi:hypothetical protein